MNCPACHNAMITLELGEVEIDHCTDCGGIWLDSGELDALLDDPTGYGRIVRDDKGDFVQIVEQLDATEEQRAIREVFPSYYCVRVEELLHALAKLTNNNRKKEYYLTDIYAILRKEGKKVLALQCCTSEDVLAPNSRQDLALADAVMQERIQRQHRDSGVSISSAINVYIEDGVSIGPDTVIHPFSFIGRDASIGGECVIGPFAVVGDRVRLGRNAVLHPHVVIYEGDDGKAVVNVIDPVQTLAAADPALAPIAAEVRERLSRAMERLA